MLLFSEHEMLIDWLCVWPYKIDDNVQWIIGSDEIINQYLTINCLILQDNKEYKLFLSSQRGILEVVKALLSEGVNPNAVNKVILYIELYAEKDETTTCSGDNTDDGTPANHTDADYNDDELLDHDNGDDHDSYDGDDGCGNYDGELDTLLFVFCSMWLCTLFNSLTDLLIFSP